MGFPHSKRSSMQSAGLMRTTTLSPRHHLAVADATDSDKFVFQEP